MSLMIGSGYTRRSGAKIKKVETIYSRLDINPDTRQRIYYVENPIRLKILNIVWRLQCKSIPTCFSYTNPHSDNLIRIRSMVIIHLIIPKQSLITITPKEILCPNILIWKFKFFFRERSMDSMIVMFNVQFIGIEQ